MSLDQRYILAPQMKEYDRIGQVWLPYLMYFHTPNYKSAVLNTDARGFRISYKGDERMTSFKQHESVCLLVGGSFVFGVGATSDKNTISSQLNSQTNSIWLNFGGRAFSSTQELLLFLLYYQQIKNIRKIVILSGMNHLALYFMSNRYSKDFGSFFFQSSYEEKMNPLSVPCRDSLFRRLLKKARGGEGGDYRYVKNRLSSDISNTLDGSCVVNRNRDDLFHVLKRDLLIWKTISESLGAELYYVLQPMASWMKRTPSAEERVLFDELDSSSDNKWNLLRTHLGYTQYEWFRDKLEDMLQSNRINFLDMNKALMGERCDGKWLFVDRVHCTDTGYRIIANILKEEVDRK